VHSAASRGGGVPHQVGDESYPCAMVSRVGSTKFKYSRGDANELGRAKGYSKRYIGDRRIASTRKDTLAAHHAFEPLVIARTTAVLRPAGRQQMKPGSIDDHCRRANLTNNEPMERYV
jgi:hypothetical protein